MKTISTTVRLAPREAEAIEEAARSRDVPKAWVVRQALRDFLARNKPTTHQYIRG